MKKQYKVGIYCRLSVDDASNSAKAKNYIPGDESASIENQYEKSNRAKYCPACAKKMRRRKEAERQRKRYHRPTHLEG